MPSVLKDNTDTVVRKIVYPRDKRTKPATTLQGSCTCVRPASGGPTVSSPARPTIGARAALSTVTARMGNVTWSRELVLVIRDAWARTVAPHAPRVPMGSIVRRSASVRTEASVDRTMVNADVQQDGWVPIVLKCVHKICTETIV
uniref:Uncharacterized protein n=1 Tax=Cacopsylla melanoneura TaxID=428564 RepID=A0A8D8W9P5_9HEMI